MKEKYGKEKEIWMAKRLYYNIHKDVSSAKGSGEKMRKPGDGEGAPTKQAFIDSARLLSLHFVKMKKKYGKKAV